MKNDEGSSVDVVVNGSSNDFVVRTVTEFHGVYKFTSLSFLVGNLRLVYNVEAGAQECESEKFIKIVPVMPTTSIVAKFPSKTSFLKKKRFQFIAFYCLFV